MVILEDFKQRHCHERDEAQSAGGTARAPLRADPTRLRRGATARISLSYALFDQSPVVL